MSDPRSTIYCSFCLKPQTEVRMLVAGGGGVHICDGCVDLCRAYMQGDQPDVSGFLPPEKLPSERLLDQLPAIEATVRGKGTQLQWVVDLLRSRKVSWAAIGAALGMSRQSAWERFS